MATVQPSVLAGPADRVTALRLTLTIVVAGLVVLSFAGVDVRLPLCALTAVALPLDALDGHVARRTGTASPRGARFDAETDALLVLVLSVFVARWLGWWVLAIGAARYAFLGAQAMWPALRGPLRAAYWRKVVAAVQGVALLVAATEALPRLASTAVVAAALVLLVASFGTEAAERLTGAGARPTVVSALALLLVWAALAMPAGGEVSTDVLRLPVEALVLLPLVLVLPGRLARTLALVAGLAAGLLLVLKVLDVGFRAVLDRTFRPVGDWTYLPSAVGVLSDSVGDTAARAVAVAAGAAALAVVVLVTVAALRTATLVRRHRRRAAQTGVGLALVGMAGSLLGAGGLSVASAQLAVDQVHQVRADLHDRGVFAAQIESDRFASRDPVLRGLRGKDVLLLFVESYGRSAVTTGSYAPGITEVLDAGTARLSRAGYAARSAFLTSPTFGAGSWLAHASVQSGLWVQGQRRYEQLLRTPRLTLSEAFHRAGWRTVLDVPANTEDWPEGERFYGVDALHDSRDVGYRGPRFGYGRVPDQYTLDWFARHELGPEPRRPVMAEIDLVSSHHPWAPLPHLVPWDRLGDGSVLEGMPEQGETAAEVLGDSDRVRSAYGRSVEYTLRTVVQWLERVRDRDLVVVVLGDHEPHHYVSGPDPGYDVPVTVIANDPAAIRRVEGWGWQPGLRPTPDAPVWRMDAFRDRFLTAFEPRVARHRVSDSGSEVPR